MGRGWVQGPQVLRPASQASLESAGPRLSPTPHASALWILWPCLSGMEWEGCLGHGWAQSHA